MDERTPASESSLWRGGCVLALAFGALTVAAFFGTEFAVFGPPRGEFSEEWPILLVWVLFAGAPFGFLALMGVRTMLPWLVAAILTVFFWGALFASVLIAARDQTGANIGMGLLMLASPFVIGGAAWIAAKATRRSS
jgi:hypothetical protein